MRPSMLLLTFAMAGCAIDSVNPTSEPVVDAVEIPAASGDIVDLLVSGPQVQPSDEPGGADLLILARVGTGEGDYVEFFASADDDEDIGIGVMAAFPNPPLIAEGFLAEHDAVSAFLALAPLDMPVPAAMLDQLDVEPDLSVERRLELKDRSAAAVDAMPPLEGAVEFASCASVKNWMNNWYGEDGSCANANGNATWNDYDLICAFGDSSCTHTLSAQGRGFCDHQDGYHELSSAHVVEGRATKIKGRWTKKGNIDWGAYGYRSHQAVSNCATSNGNLRFIRERGGSSWTKYVAPNHGYHYFYGYNVVPTSSWSYGGWKKNITPSHAYSKWNGVRVRDNSGGDDRAIMCADVSSHYLTWDDSYNGYGVPDLCTGGNCSTACFQ